MLVLRDYGCDAGSMLVSRASAQKCFCPHRYQALYNYMPRNEDELELREGDVVDVMEKCDDGWFVGTFGYCWSSKLLSVFSNR